MKKNTKTDLYKSLRYINEYNTLRWCKCGLCVWNGEWGPVYARREYDGDATDEINERRYNVLKDQLELYQKVRSIHTEFRDLT